MKSKQSSNQKMFRQGISLQESGKFDEAAEIYLRLINRHGSVAEGPFARLAYIRLSQGQLDPALEILRRGLPHNPKSAWLFHLTAVALRRKGNMAIGLNYARRALEIEPRNTSYLVTYGNLLGEFGRWREIIDIFEKSATGTSDAALWSPVLGCAYRHAGMNERALKTAQEACVRHTEDADARLEYAMALLADGQFAEGFEAYEARKQVESYNPLKTALGEWRGQPLDGKSIVILPEQGLGDAIMFGRFAQHLLELGADVTLGAYSPMQALMSTLSDRIAVVGEGARGQFDHHVYAMSLPLALGLTDTSAFAVRTPYLQAEPERVAHWREKARLDHGFRIGINWQGKPTSKMDLGRSFPVNLFESISGKSGVRLISLQKEHGLEQLGRLPLGMRVEQLGEAFDSGDQAFLDTAAVIASLDLVITSDTSIAHLAGALGARVWVVLAYGAEWRWLIDREDSPWYPTMRLFRQDSLDDWGSAFAKVEKALDLLLAERGPETPKAPVSWGELLDKITILEIKLTRITDASKLENVRNELAALNHERERHLVTNDALCASIGELKAINEELWEIEDNIRLCEKADDFGPRFIELARSVYKTNDRRAQIKKRINEMLNSSLVEEKSYA